MRIYFHDGSGGTDFECLSAEEKDQAECIAEIAAHTRRLAFSFAKMDLEKIEKTPAAAKKAGSLQEAFELFSSLKPNALKKTLEPWCPPEKKRKMDGSTEEIPRTSLALSYFLFIATGPLFQFEGKRFSKKGEKDGKIAFICDIPKWTSVRKIDAKSNPPESVLAIVSFVHHTAARKALQIGAPGAVEKAEAFLEKYGKKGSDTARMLAASPELFSEIKGPAYARDLVLELLFEKGSATPFVTASQIEKIYPQLKMPKPKGKKKAKSN